MECSPVAMKDISLLRKVCCPSLAATVLHRSRLVKILEEAVHGRVVEIAEQISPYRLGLLCAPAGYGKTTLLADFASHSTFPCCWCFLDSVDTDPMRFFKLLLASIRQRFPQFGVSLDAQMAHSIAARTDDELSLNRLKVEDLVEGFTQALSVEIGERFALILCHYYEVSGSPVINDLLNRLIQSLPFHCVLILESRAIPPLDLTPLLVRRQIFALGSQELRFTPEEIGELAQLLGREPPAEQEMERLERTFEGWIAGLVLSTYLGTLQPPKIRASSDAAWGAPALSMEREHLFAYLIKEVFSREPEAYAFLKEGVVLKRMTPELCNGLLDISDAAARLSYLERQGLFVTHDGRETDRSYSCHPMLREMLYEELRTHDTERFQQLHLRAMQLFQNEDDYEQAIAHALAAQAYEQAAGLIEGARRQVWTDGYFTTFADWIDALPQEVVVRHPGLLLARATIFLSTREHTAALPLLDQAFTASRELQDQDPMLKAELLIARGTMLFQQGEYRKAQELCEQVLALIPEDEPPLCAEAHLRMGICSCLLGKFQMGIAELQQALLLRGCEKATRQTARLHSALSAAYDLIGHFVLAEHHQMRAIQCWEQLADEWGKLNNVLELGVLKLSQCAYAEAERIFTQVLAETRIPMGFRSIKAYALHDLGELYLDTGRYQNSLSVLQDALLLGRQLEDTYLVNSILCALATTYTLLGDSQTAQTLLSPLAQAPPTGYIASLYRMALGTTLLYQRRYTQALPLLKEAEAAFRSFGMKSERIRSTIRLAACRLTQGSVDAARQYVEESLALACYGGYEPLYRLEMQRLPALIQALRKLPEAGHLYAWLDEKEEDSQLSPPPVDVLASDPPEEYPPPPHSSLVSELPSAPASTGRVAPSPETPLLRVLAFGEPAVYLNDVLITRWRLSCAMEIFFFLLNAQRAVHKEQIIAALWPDADMQSDQLLRSAIYHLRKLLGSGCIVSSAGTYRLALAAAYGEVQVWYDIEAFQQSYARAQAALAGGDEAQAYQAFEEASKLYRGDYVQSFFSDWCRSRRQELRHAYMDAHHQMALLAWGQQRFEVCIPHWQRLLALDQCLEEAHYWLMRCYMQQGKWGMALRQYHRCVSALQEELDVRPGHEIHQLYLHLTQHGKLTGGSKKST